MAKIIIIHHSGIIGGAGVSLINTIKAIAPANDVTVFVSDSPDDIVSRLRLLQGVLDFKVEIYGCRIGALTYYNGGDKLTSLRFLYRASLILKQWRYWNNILKQYNPDIVIANSIILSWISLLPEIRRRKSICFVRETICGSIRLKRNRFIRHLLCKFSRVVFISDFDRSSWNLDEKQTVIIRNCISGDDSDNSIQRDKASVTLGLSPDSFHVLYVGGVSHMKGFDIAVKSVLDLNKEINTELIAAGIDFSDRMKMGGGKLSDYEKNIQDVINQSDYGSKIHLIGRQSNMSNCYAAADVLVCPMRKAHQARPAFEAGQYSVPVIISDFPNIKEDVIDNVNGLVFNPGEISDLSKKLRIMATNHDLRREMGIKNKEMTLKNHSEECNAKLIVNLIEQVL